MITFRSLFHSIDSHHRILAGLIVGVLAFCFSPAPEISMRILLSWDAFTLTFLALTAILIVRGDPKRGVAQSTLEESSRIAIFFFVIFAGVASLVAVWLLLQGNHEASDEMKQRHVILAGITVLCSWLTTHVVFLLRYAHLYYQWDKNGNSESVGGGLEFPDEKEPDYLDFAYFSFVIGMTFQVSDVEISSRRIRRIALLHAMLSFMYNTVVLALSINLASSLV